MAIMNLVTSKAGAKREPLFNKPASAAFFGASPTNSGQYYKTFFNVVMPLTV
jgi:hypothetical protein